MNIAESNNAVGVDIISTAEILHKLTDIYKKIEALESVVNAIRYRGVDE